MAFKKWDHSTRGQEALGWQDMREKAKLRGKLEAIKVTDGHFGCHCQPLLCSHWRDFLPYDG